MHEAEQYLRNPDTPNRISVLIDGEKRRIFYNSELNAFGIMQPRKKKCGSYFSSWDKINKVFYPKPKSEKSMQEKCSKIVQKYISEARKASFTNSYIRKCLSADPNKGTYENGLTTGCGIDGQRISLKTVERVDSFCVQQFLTAFREKRNFTSYRFPFQGYEATLHVSVIQDENNPSAPIEVQGSLSKEYKDCGNGYYYILINDNYFIGYDID